MKLWVGAFAGDAVKLRPRRALSQKAQEREWVVGISAAGNLAQVPPMRNPWME